MTEGLLKKKSVYVAKGYSSVKPIYRTDVEMVPVEVLDEAKRDFVLSEDELFELQEYGFEDDNNLTQGAINLKIEILQKIARKYLEKTEKWFGEAEK